MRETAAKPLVESALMAAVGAVLILISFYVPVIGFVAGLVCPVPFALVVMRHGVRWGLLSSVVTALSLLLFLDILTVVALWVVSGLTGVAFGYAITSGFSPSRTILFTAVAFLLGIVAAFLSLYFISGITPGKFVEQMVDSFAKSLEISEKLFGSNPQMEELTKVILSKETALQVLPSAILMASVFQAYLNFEVMRRVLPRLGHSLEPLPPFSRWIFPDYVAFAAILSFIAAVTVNYHGIPLLAQAGQQIFVLTGFFGMLEAVSVMVFYLLRFGLPRFFIGFVCLFVVTQYILVPSGLTQLFVVFGMMDMLMDFRHLRFEIYKDL